MLQLVDGCRRREHQGYRSRFPEVHTRRWIVGDVSPAEGLERLIYESNGCLPIRYFNAVDREHVLREPVPLHVYQPERLRPETEERQQTQKHDESGSNQIGTMCHA